MFLSDMNSLKSNSACRHIPIIAQMLKNKTLSRRLLANETKQVSDNNRKERPIVMKILFVSNINNNGFMNSKIISRYMIRLCFIISLLILVQFPYIVYLMLF